MGTWILYREELLTCVVAGSPLKWSSGAHFPTPMAALLVDSAVDERATLEAAFALIDDCERSVAADERALGEALAASAPVFELEAAILGDLDADARLGSLSPASSHSSCLEVKPKRRRVSDTKKEEIARLRADVATLQARAELLAKIKGRSERLGGRRSATLVAVATQPTAFRIGFSSNEAPAGGSPFDNVWKDIAERQRRRRAVSDMENIRLRSLIKAHQRTVKNLQSVLQRQAALDVSCADLSCVGSDGSNLLCPVSQTIRSPPVRRGKSVRNSFTPEEAATLRELDSELNQYYLASDYAFQLNGLAANAYAPVSKMLVTKLSAKKTHVQLLESALLPLDFKEAVSTMWNFHLRGSAPDRVRLAWMGVAAWSTTLTIDFI